MGSEPSIDIESLVLPISEDRPSGKSLAYEAEFDALRNARRSEDDTLQGDWQRDVKAADWDLVIELGSRCLREQTKDLQIAAWMTEALGQLHSFAGIRDGFRLLCAIQDNFWADYHPQIEDGDLDSRIGPFLFLNDPKLLPNLVKSLPLTRAYDGSGYNYKRYRESRETDNEIRKNPDRADELLGEGKLTGEKFDAAIAQTPKAFYALLVADLKECLEAIQAFERSTDEHFGSDAPSLLNIVKALEECIRFAEPVLTEKRKLEPDPIVAAPASEQESDQTSESAPGAEPGGGLASLSGMLGQRSGGDPGRVLIDFLEGAKELSEIGERLKENRQKYAELTEELRALDAEYEQLSLTISRNREFFDLLTRVNALRGQGG